MKKATTFMAEKAAYARAAMSGATCSTSAPARRDGGLPDYDLGPAARHGDVGHLFLDAYHATRRRVRLPTAAKRAAGALIKIQHPAGGWNCWATWPGRVAEEVVRHHRGKNGWRLEEFQHYYGNATFDDEGHCRELPLCCTYLEKKDKALAGAGQGTSSPSTASIRTVALAPALPAVGRLREQGPPRLHRPSPSMTAWSTRTSSSC